MWRPGGRKEREKREKEKREKEEGGRKGLPFI